MNNDNGVADLDERFRGRGLAFRCFPDARFSMLRYQAGVIETERRIVPKEIGTGHRAVEVSAETFRLVAFSGTADELADKLARLPPPPWRELLY
jgi:hypothetical protein